MINGWYSNIDYPNWYTSESIQTISNGYLQENETPRQAYLRVASALADYLPEDKFDREKYKKRWFDYMWKGWLCPATPVLSNVGTRGGLPISCYLLRVGDSTLSIFDKVKEMALLTKWGGGVGVDWGKVRGRGEAISTGGFTEGIVPFLKVYDSTIVSVSQGATRRGAAAMYLPARHKDIEEFVKIREPKGDVNRQCLNLFNAVSIDDHFMNKLIEGDTFYRQQWGEFMRLRLETGAPYLMFYDNVNRFTPDCYKKRGLKVNQSNLCTEILEYTDPDHTAVCCLSSLNVARYKDWQDHTSFIQDVILFLDCVMEDFITRAKNLVGFENAVRFAEKLRPLGLGVLGWHTFLQNEGLPFISLGARGYINKIGKKLKEEGERASRQLGKTLGIPEWCDDSRNSMLFAIAPTTSNSLLSGGVSQGIEPLIANAWVQKSAKGTFLRKNRTLEALLQVKEQDTDETWESIQKNNGSVQQLSFLTEEEKEVYLTAVEINQLDLIDFASVWQGHIDQGISLNLFFPADVNPKFYNQCHISAWQKGIKTLYYVRSESVAARNLRANTFSESCKFCEG
jgi:ribonucleoside-diphosphate reductase alpha chain